MLEQKKLYIGQTFVAARKIYNTNKEIVAYVPSKCSYDSYHTGSEPHHVVYYWNSKGKILSLNGEGETGVSSHATIADLEGYKTITRVCHKLNDSLLESKLSRIQDKETRKEIAQKHKHVVDVVMRYAQQFIEEFNIIEYYSQANSSNLLL